MKFVGALAALVVLGTVGVQGDCGARGCGDDEHDDWLVYRDHRGGAIRIAAVAAPG